MSPRKGQPADDVTRAILDAGRAKGHAKRKAAAAARKGADMSGTAPPAPTSGHVPDGSEDDPTAPRVVDSPYTPVPPPPNPPTRRTDPAPTPTPTPTDEPGVQEPPTDRSDTPTRSKPVGGVLDWLLSGLRNDP